MEGYSVLVVNASKELTKREKVMVKDFADALSLDEATENGDAIIIAPDFHVVLDVHNEKSDNKDYSKFIIFDTAGQKYVTGSNSFWDSFMNIFNEMEGEPFEIKVYKKPSKNYKGKGFLTCSLI